MPNTTPSPSVVELVLPPHGTPATKEQLQMHPVDYALLERAANSQKQGIGDFILLGAYLHARDVLAEIQPSAAATPDGYYLTDDASITTAEHGHATKF